ncbi:MAG: tRNA dihydrouridine synthase DusB [Deltaproteobacteria bacterium]|nr:tRNA dihydrouridine synthase DusB [Deltaproteobacteria bacterium]
MSNSKLKIGSLTLENNVVLAPMAGITNSPFRQICKQSGAGLVYSEMISANGLIRDGQRTVELLQRSPAETPFGVQLFGDDPTVLAEAAKIISDYGEILDLNMGCPVKKVVRSGAGSALMQNPAHAGDVISAMRKASPLPMTVKFRSGWDTATINFIEIGKIAEQCGADALILHPRTRCQGFGGQANWNHITQLKQAVNIPVIGSGDIMTADDGLRMIQQTGCDGIMIGRGCYGNPWLIENILRQQKGKDLRDISAQQRLQTIIRHLKLYQQSFGDRRAAAEMRKHLCWYSRGLTGAGEFRFKVNQIDQINELEEVICSFFSGLE